MSTIVTASFFSNLAFSSSAVIRSISGGFVWSGLACAGSWTPAAPTPAINAPIMIDKKNAQTNTAHFLKLIWSSPVEVQGLKEAQSFYICHTPFEKWRMAYGYDFRANSKTP